MLRCRRPLIVASVVAVAAALLAAGCGSGGSPGVVNVASSATGATTTQNGLVGYSVCMRSNGVPNFPDPTSSGGLPKEAVVSALQAISNSQAAAAQNTCKHLLPAGGSLSGKASQPVTAQDREDYLKAAACMRSHGFSDFPDPTFPNNGVETNIPSTIDQDSSQFKSAAAICTKLIPTGLPYSSAGAP